MKRLVINIILLVVAASAAGQTLGVKNFAPAPTDLTASTAVRYDVNEVECALVKIVAPNLDFSVQGNVVGQVDKHGSEYWCYVVNGTKILRIVPEKYEPLDLRFENYGIPSLLRKNTYILTLDVPELASQDTDFKPGEIDFKDIGKIESRQYQTGDGRSVSEGYSKTFKKRCLYSKTDENIYCNGIYIYNKSADPDPAAKYWEVNLDSLNLSNFEIDLEYCPEHYNQYIISLSHWDRILNCFINGEGYLSIRTNNQSHKYSTPVKVAPNEWNKLNIRFYNGQMSINGYVCDKIVMNLTDVDKYLSTMEFGCGRAYCGLLRNINVYSYDTIEVTGKAEVKLNVTTKVNRNSYCK